MTTHTRIEHHPDLVAMRAQYERAGATPSAQAVEGLSLLAGMYLAISPWVVGFNGGATNTIAINNLIVGLAVAALAFSFGSIYERTHGMGMVAAALGAWTVVAPWVVSGPVDTTKIIVSNIITGALICLLGLTTMVLGRMGR
ncbi:SPW repeat protein [Streptomyces capparidis]